MARNGIAKGANKGHITEQIAKVAKPAARKGVSQLYYEIVSSPLMDCCR
jgi:hypothetical protein